MWQTTVNGIPTKGISKAWILRAGDAWYQFQQWFEMRWMKILLKGAKKGSVIAGVKRCMGETELKKDLGRWYWCSQASDLYRRKTTGTDSFTGYAGWESVLIRQIHSGQQNWQTGWPTSRTRLSGFEMNGQGPSQYKGKADSDAVKASPSIQAVIAQSNSENCSVSETVTGMQARHSGIRWQQGNPNHVKVTGTDG